MISHCGKGALYSEQVSSVAGLSRNDLLGFAVWLGPVAELESSERLPVFVLRANLLKRARDRAIDLLFPRVCIACQAEHEEFSDGASICQPCRNRLPLVNWPVCKRCAAKVPELLVTQDDCTRCRQEQWRFDGVLAFGKYDGLLRDLVLRMKSDRSEHVANCLGKLMASQFRECLERNPAAVMVPIPSTPWRRLSRGTNSASALAEVVGSALRIPVVNMLRRRNSRQQLGLSRAGRIRNMRGGLALRAGYPLAAPKVLIVDDVLTTGATCSEAARVLKRGGAGRVTVLVAGRTYDD